ncbi:efflux (PET) family inner membrane protein YccS [Klebsiella michiganensis]|uniref:Efflux (PET) family inner membrane protein YccS n=1 Tax=Klebsiella michiganensis TaxID=1134687 RepID=A0A7H4N2F5_9ENTR|nr:efflux (PET) family inner membrane protein YccS [Klebsiella michiganensis]
MLTPLLRRYTWNSAWLYNIRIFIALCGTTAFPWWLGEVKLTIPLTLGVVAAALTDLDDRLTGRLRNLAITLVCFFIASASVELLFPWPWLFAAGLTVSTIGFILLRRPGPTLCHHRLWCFVNSPSIPCWALRFTATGIFSRCFCWLARCGTTYLPSPDI